MDYIIVSTSRCLYQDWQLRVLNWSRKKVKQSGKLLLLLSEDKAHSNEIVNMDFGPGTEVVDLPDWAHQWKTEHNDWWGGIPNKYESFNWLAEEYPFNSDDVLLFLDPDMIFIRCVDYQPGEKEIIGQEWKNYGSLKGWKKYKRAFMYPFCLRAGVLKLIKDDFKEYCFQIRKQEKRWESDMWALDYAAKNNGINISYIRDLGYCTVWQPNGDESLSPIIHYPNVVKDAEGEKIFFKQDFTFNPSQKIEIHRARNRTDKHLLINISQERTDYLYHLKWNFDHLFKFYAGSQGYIVMEPWKGGFNNIRMSLELGVCIAYLTNRTLVLPMCYQMYLLQGKSDFSDFFDTNKLGVKNLSLEEFCSSHGIEPKLDEVKQISKVLDYDAVGHVINFELVPVPEKFRKWRKVLNNEELFDGSEILYLDKNQLGNFYQTLYTSRDAELKMLIAKHVVYRNEIFDIAWQFINYLGDRTYYAIHIRRNEFQYKDLFISCEEIVDNIKDIIPENSYLYIATDHKKRGIFQALADRYNIRFYQDISEKLDIGEFNVNWIPIVEQFICTRAIKFVGMKLSTLSSHVYRMRGYMEDIEDKQYYVNTEKYKPENQFRFEEDNKYLANWAREYKDSWDFHQPSIFVSISAYCDQQLIPTICNMLEQASTPSRVVIGVHIQDTAENYQKLLEYEFPNLRCIYTPKDESKGVVWARNRIKRELFGDEDYYLQIDSHSRFKQNWDNILIKQYQSIEIPNLIITTYPNHFEISDEKQEYLNLDKNSPLKIRKFLSKYPKDNRLRPENLRSVKDYEIAETKWCSAGFLFTKGEWVMDVILPDNIKFNGEEDLMIIMSFRKGYNLRVPSEATVWHNYNFKNPITGERYKEFNQNEISDDSLNIVNNHLFNVPYDRSLEELESYLDIRFRRIQGLESIFVGITAYLDQELHATISDCISKAGNPQRLHFGICLQYDWGKDTGESCIDDLIKNHSISIIKHPHSKSGGPCWARHQMQQLFRNERFYLHVDAHTRFVKNWDRLLIENLNDLKAECGKPVISYRPPSYKRDETQNRDHSFQFEKELDKINIPKITGIDEDYCVEYLDYNFRNTNLDSIRIPVLDNSFLFHEGIWLKELEQDPKMYYVGEEMTLSIRAFTKGFFIFTPRQNLAWHRTRDYENKKHYNIQSPEIVKQLHELSIARLKLLVEGGNLVKYGLGEKRTLRQFMDFSGINFRQKQVKSKDFWEMAKEEREAQSSRPKAKEEV